MKNFKLNFFHICDYASFTTSGKLNILGIFKSINAPKLPYIFPQMFVIANVTVSKSGKYNEYIKIVAKDGSEVAQLKFPVNVQIPKGKKVGHLGVVGQLNNITFKKKGTYRFKLYIDDILLGEQKIQLKVQSNNSAEKTENAKTK